MTKITMTYLEEQLVKAREELERVEMLKIEGLTVGGFKGEYISMEEVIENREERIMFINGKITTLKHEKETG